jgi:hypothetical protein
MRTKVDPVRGDGRVVRTRVVGGRPAGDGAWPGDPSRCREGGFRACRLLGDQDSAIGAGLQSRGSSYLRGEAPGPGDRGGSGCGARAPPRLLHHNIPRPGARGPRGRAPSGGGARGGGGGARGGGRGAILGRARAREALGAALAGAYPCPTLQDPHRW